MKKIGIILITIFILAQPVGAADINSQITQELKNELSYFKNALPEDVEKFIGEGPLNGDFNGLLGDNFSEKSFLELTFTYLSSGLNTVLKSFSSILVLLLILAVFNAFVNSTSGTLENIFTLCSTLCMSLAVFKISLSLTNNTTIYMELLCEVTKAFLPIVIAILTMGGNVSTAIVSNGSFLLFISLTEEFLLKFMLPTVNVCLAFSIIRALNNSVDFSGISKTVKTVFTSVTVFVMSIFMFVLSYKNVLSQGADSLSIKTARFAISSFVPLVGSSVNDALRTLSSSLSLIKSSCGIIAIVSIAIITLPIIINLFLNKISFSILAIISGAIGAQSEKGILEEADSICSFLLTLTACISTLFIFGLTIFIKTGSGFV